MNKGFTLVEMLVVCLIFSIIIGAVTAVFVSAIKAQRYNLAYQQLLDQTSYALEYMARSIRMAQEDNNTCIPSDTMTYASTASGHGVKFKNYNNECIEFVGEGGGGYVLKAKKLPVSPSGYELPLIATSDLEITNIWFQVFDDCPPPLCIPSFQPKVTVFMEIRGRGLEPQPKIRIQTTISQRNLDI